MKNPVARLPIRNKIAGIILMIEAALLALLLASTHLAIGKGMEEDLQNNLRQTTALLGAALGSNLVENRPGHAQDLLDGLQGEDLPYLVLLDQAGRRLASVGWPEGEPLPEPLLSPFQPDALSLNIVPVRSTVRSEGRTLGFLHYGYSTDSLHRVQEEILQRTILIGGLGLVVTFALVLAVGMRLSRRLDTMAMVSRRIAEGDQECRVPPMGEDEIGLLASNLNAMAQALQHRLRTLGESEERFRTLVEQAAGAFFVHDMTGRIVDVNRQACVMLGYSREELLELCIGDIETRSREMDVESTWKQMRPGEPFLVDGLARRKDGTELPVEVRICQYRLQGELFISAMVQDISERRASEEQLRQALDVTEKALLQVENVIKSDPNGLVVTDETGRVTLMNRNAESILGLDAARAQGLPAEDLAQMSPNPEQVRSFLTGPLEAMRSADLTFASTGSPHPCIARATLTPMQGKDGKSKGSIIVLQNVTRERETDRMKDEFISTAAHELRTPLAAIMGYAELLLNAREQGGFTPEQEKEFLSVIFEKSVFLDRLTDQLLDLSRIQAGRAIPLERSDCDLSQILTKVVKNFPLDSEKHRLNLSVPEGENLHGHLDGHKVEQLLENILGNAVKYSPEGGTVAITGFGAGNRVRVSVRDEGIGMTPEEAERVFEKFYRSERSQEAAPGLGLGMNIVKHIIDQHGGEIEVKSALGEGTTVTVSLPKGF
ncbi:MAG: hypothetical protein C0617_10875 [Desulfuromonas sp.]|uniref:PAS domain S-box protein n=1 Tax=Desulfuromonas sp. TaxID=892 RepID=UPI000CADA778|nr:PAS domain S-box protein [Desulfuromonas sp.]PLX83632.1 MAG: hypothetical protein C0617_10875 [Desulfuromonas sp.]